MGIQININCEYKGARTYIQGPDIYEATIHQLNELNINGITNIDLSFHKIVSNQMTGKLFSEQKDVPTENVSALLRFNHQSTTYFLAISETEKLITERNEYQEERIVEKCNVEDKTITLNNVELDKFNNLEKIVAMNKFFLTDYFKQIKGKWIFSKLQTEFDMNTEKPNEIGIILIKNMGVKLTKSTITFDSKKIGTIYFSMI